MNGRRRLLILPVLVILLFFLINRLGANNSDHLNDQGVRPDVALAIDDRFPDSERMRLAARQCARAIQKAIEHPDDAWVISEEVSRASSCIWAVAAKDEIDDDEALDIPTWLESLVVNTWSRSSTYLKYNAKLSGGVFSVLSADLANCTFGTK